MLFDLNYCKNPQDNNNKNGNKINLAFIHFLKHDTYD